MRPKKKISFYISAFIFAISTFFLYQVYGQETISSKQLATDTKNILMEIKETFNLNDSQMNKLRETKKILSGFSESQWTELKRIIRKWTEDVGQTVQVEPSQMMNQCQQMMKQCQNMMQQGMEMGQQKMKQGMARGQEMMQEGQKMMQKGMSMCPMCAQISPPKTAENN